MFIKALTEKRAIDASQFPFAEMQDGSATHAGIAVDQDSALTYSAVYACVRLLSETVGALPWGVYEKTETGRRPCPNPPAWIEQPNRECTPMEFKERVQASLELDGNAYVLITARDRVGRPAELFVLHPQDVVPERGPDNELRYRHKGTQVLTRYSRATQGGDLLHIKGFGTDGDKGLSPIALARQTIGLGLTTEKFGGRFFGAGQNPSGVIEMNDGVKADETFKKTVKETWRFNQGGTDRSHLPAVLQGASWKPITIPPEQAQFLQTRKFQINEVARWFRVQPHLLQDLERATFSNIEHQGIDFVVYSLTHRLVRNEDGFNQLLAPNEYLKWNVNGLLRGDMKSRFEAYAIGKQNGFTTTNMILALEDQNPVDGGDEFVQQLNLAPVGQRATFKEQIDAAGVLVRAGYDPADSLTLVGLDPIKHTGALPVTVTVQTEDLPTKPPMGQGDSA